MALVKDPETGRELAQAYHLEILGSGANRRVYSLNDDWVFKSATAAGDGREAQWANAFPHQTCQIRAHGTCKVRLVEGGVHKDHMMDFEIQAKLAMLLVECLSTFEHGSDNLAEVLACYVCVVVYLEACEPA